jgi:hypothetical protein
MGRRFGSVLSAILDKLSSEAVTDKVENGLGLSGEDEEGIRSHSLNCAIATMTQSL